MHNKLRFTGEWPPLEILGKYPNWEYALDEEGVEGQDETTIRPESQQKVISKDTAYTAANATQADGTRRIAIVAIVGGHIDAADVFIGDNNAWRVGLNNNQWEPFVQTWLPEDKRMPWVSISDEAIFPLVVTTVLPMNETSKSIEVVIK